MSSPRSRSSVTFCITELDVGGAEKALVRIASGLQAMGWEVRVISLRDRGPLAEDLEAAGISVTNLNCGGFGDFRVYFRLLPELRKHAPNVIMGFLHQANFYARLAGRRLGIPVVSGVRVADRRRWVTLTDRLTGCCTIHYIAVSQSVARTHAELCRIPEDRISAIPNGVEIPSGTHQPSDDGEQEILYVGRLTEQKAPLTLLEAFRRLPDSVRLRTRLTYVGEGELRNRLASAIRKAGLADRTELVGHCSDVSERMQRATILALPSLWEGMPNVVLEAMATGLPVVATNVDGTSELISDGESGWLVEPGDTGQLADALAKALNCRELREKYAVAAQNVANTHFSWENVVSQYDVRLRSIAGN